MTASSLRPPVDPSFSHRVPPPHLHTSSSRAAPVASHATDGLIPELLKEHHQLSVFWAQDREAQGGGSGALSGGQDKVKEVRSGGVREEVAAEQDRESQLEARGEG
jgi:hypothetical protein